MKKYTLPQAVMFLLGGILIGVLASFFGITHAVKHWPRTTYVPIISGPMQMHIGISEEDGSNTLCGDDGTAYTMIDSKRGYIDLAITGKDGPPVNGRPSILSVNCKQ
jgi:hypothetical protein